MLPSKVFLTIELIVFELLNQNQVVIFDAGGGKILYTLPKLGVKKLFFAIWTHKISIFGSKDVKLYSEYVGPLQIVRRNSFESAITVLSFSRAAC